jgi:hypothetical protein
MIPVERIEEDKRMVDEMDVCDEWMSTIDVIAMAEE